MNTININEKDLKYIISKILNEDNTYIEPFNKNKTYTLNFQEIYQIKNDLIKVYNFLVDNSKYIDNKPEVNDRINRLKRSFKILEKKFN